MNSTRWKSKEMLGYRRQVKKVTSIGTLRNVTTSHHYGMSAISALSPSAKTGSDVEPNINLRLHLLYLVVFKVDALLNNITLKINVSPGDGFIPLCMNFKDPEQKSEEDSLEIPGSCSYASSGRPLRIFFCTSFYSHF